MENFPIAEITGTSYEIGYQEGSLFKEKVAGTIQCYREMFKDYSNLEWERAKELSTRFIDVIREYNPDYLEEIRGVAEGSGFSFEDILALNCRSELVFVGNEMDKADGGCTSIGINSGAGKEGDAFLAHNWDWKPSQRNNMIMLKIRQKNGKPDIFMVTEAGIIGKTGFNSAGLCLYLNALSTDQAPPAGLPLHMAMRGILDCTNLTDALAAATKFHLGCCANFMIGHKNGECVDIEIENEEFDVLYPRDGILVHTNHFISPLLPIRPRRDTCKQKFTDTFIRLGRADRLIREKGKDISETDLMEVLRDHVEYPSCICRHEDVRLPEELRMGTVFSMIVNLTKGKIYFCKGNPCETSYEEYEL